MQRRSSKSDVEGMVADVREQEKFGYKPRGQRGYQPRSSKPLDPMKLTPPSGGSAVQPPPASTNNGTTART